MRRMTVWAIVTGAMFLLTPGTAAQTHDHDHGGTEASSDHEHLVVLSGGARVDADQSFHDIVVFHGDVLMEGEVHDLLLVFHGDVTVTGHVVGDVVVFEGAVTIASGAVIDGDVASFSEPVIEEGAEVRGEIRKPSRDFFRPVEVFAARVALWLAATVSLFLLGALLLAFAPRGMDAIARVWDAGKGTAALWGLVVLIGLPLGAILLMVTLVGIPFGLGTLLALALLYSIGYVVGAWAFGRSIVREPRSRWLSFLAGFAIVRLLGLIPIVGGIVSLVVLVVGLGVAAVTIWRARTAPVAAAG